MAAVDFHALGQVVWVSLVAGVGVTVLFSLVICGADKAAVARREGQDGQALAYGALAVAAMVVFSVAVVLGVIVMLRKDYSARAVAARDRHRLLGRPVPRVAVAGQQVARAVSAIRSSDARFSSLSASAALATSRGPVSAVYGSRVTSASPVITVSRSGRCSATCPACGRAWRRRAGALAREGRRRRRTG